MDKKFIEMIPDEKIRSFAEEQYKKVKTREHQVSELQSEIIKLNKQLGIQPDGFIDTPSLNIVMFDLSGQPCCSKHGVMNRYEHQIYRCVMCGIAIQLGVPYSIISTSKSMEVNESGV